MITSVDTNVLLDVLIPESANWEPSKSQLRESLKTGLVIISEAVYAELAVRFKTREDLDLFLKDTCIELRQSGEQACYLAGQAWREYLSRRSSVSICPSCGSPQTWQCQSCGGMIRPRRALITDFLIGAHAAVHADRLLTRDRGYFRTYFPDLRLS